MTDTATKPKRPTGRKAESFTPDEQKRRFTEVCDALAGDGVEKAAVVT